MEPREYRTVDLLKNFNALRNTSPMLPNYAHELSIRNDEIACVYAPRRGNTQDFQCPNMAITKWGYCTKHKETLQSKRAKERYEAALSKYVAPPPQKVKEEVVPTPKPTLRKVETPKPTPRASKPVPETPPSPPPSKPSQTPQRPRRVSTFLNTYGGNEESEEEEISAPEEKSESADEDSDSNPNVYEDDEQIQVRLIRNEWGNYWHPKSRIVFDITKKAAYGVQHKDGQVYTLGQTEINFCDKHGWPYLTKGVGDDSSSEEETDEEETSEEESSSEEEDELSHDEFDSSDEES